MELLTLTMGTEPHLLPPLPLPVQVSGEDGQESLESMLMVMELLISTLSVQEPDMPAGLIDQAFMVLTVLMDGLMVMETTAGDGDQQALHEDLFHETSAIRKKLINDVA